jgi:hypothetical protein
MKNILLLSFILVISTSISLCQKTDVISEVPPLRKGEIILIDGTAVIFKQLNVVNDTVHFTNSQSMPGKFSANDIYRISKTGNYAAEGALSAGLGWMLGAWIGTMNWDNVGLEDSKNTYIFGGALISAAVGGLIGALIKKEKIIYKNPATLKLTPISDLGLGNQPGVMLTLRININSK